MTAKIIQLAQFSGLPTGNEIFEVSNGGNGSFQIAMAILASARQPNIISVGGSTTISSTNYGDWYVTTTSAVTLTLPSVLLRSGVPVSIIAITTGTPSITIAPFAGQTILGLSNNLTIVNSYGSYTLWPNSTGSGDWYQK